MRTDVSFEVAAVAEGLLALKEGAIHHWLGGIFLNLLLVLLLFQY
jgi:hypothetical protein